MKSNKVFIEHILSAIENIELYIADSSKEAFFEDSKTQSAVVRQLEIIGEAVRSISTDLKSKYSYIAWSKIAAMRNILIHVYYEVDYEIVWKTIHESLPEFKKMLAEIKESEK